MATNQMLVRCSSLSKLRTKPQKAGETVAETTKKYLLREFAFWHHGRKEEQSNKYIEKGHARENDSLDLISRKIKRVLVKNTVRLSDSYITGEVDAFECIGIDPELWNVTRATDTHDAKSSWSLITFLESKLSKNVDDEYYWQGVGYMRLTGAQRHHVHHCLVNGTPQAIDKEKYYLKLALGIIDDSIENETYNEKAKQIERNHIFDLGEFMNENPWYDLTHEPSEWSFDIPYHQRISTKTIERNEEEINWIPIGVTNARVYVANTFLNG